MIRLSALLLILVSATGLLNLPNSNRPGLKAPVVGQGPRTPPAAIAPNEQTQKSSAVDSEIKELAAGNHCLVMEAFVFVARDLPTYQALMSLDINLPNKDAEFFNSQLVIAAFLGQRRTGGFTVELTQSADGNVRVAERAPREMATSSLTSPFKIVALPVKTDGPLSLTLDQTWKERLRTYRLVGGELTITGGFAGIQQTATLSGSIQVMRQRRLATLLFDLKSTGKRSAQVSDVASGTVTNSGLLSFSYLDSAKLTGAIQSPFKATGQFINDERELSLNLETVPSPHISDNFTAAGSLRAIATTSKPANRAIAAAD